MPINGSMPKPTPRLMPISSYVNVTQSHGFFNNQGDLDTHLRGRTMGSSLNSTQKMTTQPIAANQFNARLIHSHAQQTTPPRQEAQQLEKGKKRLG